MLTLLHNWGLCLVNGTSDWNVDDSLITMTDDDIVNLWLSSPATDHMDAFKVELGQFVARCIICGKHVIPCSIAASWSLDFTSLVFPII